MSACLNKTHRSQHQEQEQEQEQRGKSGYGEVCASQYELDAIADALGTRSSDVGTLLAAIQSLEDKVRGVPDVATTLWRAEALERLAERLEADAAREQERERKLADEIAERERAQEAKQAARQAEECSWDGACGNEDTLLDDLSCLVAGEDEEDDRDEFSHRKVCALADTSRQLEARQHELLRSVSASEADIGVLLPVISALEPDSPDEQEDEKLGAMLEQALADAQRQLQEASDKLQDAVNLI